MIDFYRLDVKIAKRTDLQPSDKLVYAVLETHQGSNQDSWPGTRLIAREAGITRRTAMRSISRLETVGALRVIEQGNGRRNRYQTGDRITPVKGVHRCKTVTGTGDRNSPEAVKNCHTGKEKNRTGEKAPADTAFFDRWNRKPGLPKIRAITNGRKAKLRARLREKTFADNWGKIIDQIAASDFLIGKNDRGWRADIDWVLANDTNYAKVLEGKYNGGNGRLQPRPVRFDEKAAQQRARALAHG